MTFTSMFFPLFLVATLCVYYFLANNVKTQNALLVCASLLFYGWGHPHYIYIWLGISLFTWTIAQCIDKTKNAQKLIAIAGITLIVVLFLVFKYSAMILGMLNLKASGSFQAIQVLAPIGLSFYSFTCIGYIADVYTKRIAATSSIIQFLAYSSFFPQILSGPISFADEQLPQFGSRRIFSSLNFKEGLPFVIWGLFKKIVISNTLIKPIAYIFSHTHDLHGMSLFIGLVIYSIQVYADFSGYSDMAYGIARFFGIKIRLNFRMPYFSKNISEYWRNWHNSLSTWFGRYIYVPLGGNKGSFIIHLRNIIIVFAISGLWHGANIKFVMWGLLNASFYCIYLINEKTKEQTFQFNTRYTVNSFVLPSILLTFLAVSFARIYFRADTWSQGNDYLTHLAQNYGAQYTLFGFKYLILCAVFMAFEWIQRFRKSPLEMSGHKVALQTLLYAVSIAFIIIALQQPQTTECIYFKY